MNVRRNILFVDDEPTFLKSVGRMLHDERFVWEIAFAGGTDEALAAVRRRPFDAVVADIRMPDRNGFVLLAKLCADPATKDIPVIILTGDEDAELKATALELGAMDLLNKPVRTEDLVARLQSALRLKDAQDQLAALNRDLEMKVAMRTRELAHSRLQIIWRLAKAGEYRDVTTGNHVIRVGCYARALAEQLGMPDDFVEMLSLTAPLHDIGKIGIPDRILLKLDRLTAEEERIMHRHCIIGADILAQQPRCMRQFLARNGAFRGDDCATHPDRLLETAAAIALSHHEKWDGLGYPHGLAGEHIPIEARIVAAADLYDALGSVRPYKPAFPDEKVYETMKREAGHHLDPRIHEAFEACIEALRAVRCKLADNMYPVDSDVTP